MFENVSSKTGEGEGGDISKVMLPLNLASGCFSGMLCCRVPPDFSVT